MKPGEIDHRSMASVIIGLFHYNDVIIDVEFFQFTFKNGGERVFNYAKDNSPTSKNCTKLGSKIKA